MADVVSYTYLLTPEGHQRVPVARTVEASESARVDVDAEGRVVGVEVLGDGDWRDALASLAAQGRLRVT